MSSKLARWLPIDKPVGYTSHDVVAKARRQLGLKKIGHTGTLDPDVTGVLVLALGKATRFIQYLKGDKRYRARIQLGLSTDSYDLSGQILQEHTVPELSIQALDAALEPFRGEIQQQPPMVSAVSYKGQRLYKLARAGVEIPERPARSVHFYQIQVLSWNSPFLELDIHCSSGTYIRSLAHDLGESLGCGGTLAWLRRSAANGVSEEQLVQLDTLQPLSEVPSPGLELSSLLTHIPTLSLEPELCQRLCQGQRIPLDALPLQPESNTEMLRLYNGAHFLGLVSLDGELLRPKLILNDSLVK